MKRAEIEQLLPEIFRRTVRPGTPLAALLDVMEELHEPSEEVLHELDRHFDAARCADSMVPYLALWVDLDWLLSRAEDEPHSEGRPFPAGMGRLRLLIERAFRLSQWRGTRRGLQLFLETATGLAGFQIQEQPPDSIGRPRPFHLRIVAPAEAKPLSLLIERIVEQERPAFVTYELEFAAPAANSEEKENSLQPD